MALTMRHVLDELDDLQRRSNGNAPRPEVVREVARAALMGARGNSGVILSQIVRGAAEKCGDPARPADRPRADRGRAHQRRRSRLRLGPRPRGGDDADRDPGDGRRRRRAPGPMALASASHPDATDAEQNALLAEMLATALFAGEEAVRHTPEQLDVLAEAGVVDAGALGLVVIMRGMVVRARRRAGPVARDPPLRRRSARPGPSRRLALPLVHELHRHRRRTRRRLVRRCPRATRRLGARGRRRGDAQDPRPHRRPGCGEGPVRRPRRGAARGHRRHARAGRRSARAAVGRPRRGRGGRRRRRHAGPVRGPRGACRRRRADAESTHQGPARGDRGLRARPR